MDFDVEKQCLAVSNEEIRVVPAFSENNVAVCLFASNEYAPFCGVLVSSIISNSNTRNNYDIIILERNISDRNKKLIFDLVKADTNFSVRFVNMMDISETLTIEIHSHFAIEACLKLFLMSDYFAAYDKIIALDSDLIVEKDIADLFTTDIKEYYMAACDDPIMKHLLTIDGYRSAGNSPKLLLEEYIADYLGLGTADIYYNTGVIVLNLALCRRHELFEEAIRLLNNKGYWFQEQDVFNEVCGKNTKLLNLRWNALNGQGNLDKMKEDLSEEFLKLYIDSLDNYYIMHFAGKHKPWYNPAIDFSDLFYKYARQTVWYEHIISLISKKQVYDHTSRRLNYIDNRLKHVESYVDCEKGFLKRIIKKIGMPFINLILPKGTQRREQVKKTWWNIRAFYHRCFERELLKARAEMQTRLKKERRLAKRAGTPENLNLEALKNLKGKFKGQRCFIIGTGPSLTVEDLEKLEGETTFSLNSIYKMFPQTEWRPDFYFNNDIMLSYGMKMPQEVRWKYLTECLSQYSFKTAFISSSKFNEEIRAVYSGKTVFLPTVDYIYQINRPKRPQFGSDCTKKVHAYGTTVYLIFQLAVYMGFSKIYLLGTDCSYTGAKKHAYKSDKEEKALYNDNTHNGNLERALETGFDAIRYYARKNSVEVFNATRGGKLELFPRVNLDALLEKKEN